MTARPPTRRCSRKTRRSCRKNCKSAPRKPARSCSSPLRPAAQLRRPILPPSNRRSNRLAISRNKKAPDRRARIVGQQVLLGNIGDIFRFRVLGEQMIKRLVLVRTDVLGDRQPPFLGIVKFRIDVENHAPERKHPVADDLPDLKLGGTRFYHVSSNRP